MQLQAMASRSLSRAPSYAALAALESALASFRISQLTTPTIGTVTRRNASHQAQGRANKAKQGPGKRLGAKKTGGEYVVTGNIIFKQRGTHWFPGDNCFMGRDHTIHAGTPGYVTYYRDPARHPNRKYIGIVFERHQSLPQPPNAPRRRKLGMLAYQMTSPDIEHGDAVASSVLGDTVDPASATAAIREEPNKKPSKETKRSRAGGDLTLNLPLRPGYQYRRANWEIGRAAEMSETARKVVPFKPGDRFAAWRKTTARKAKNAERRAMGRGGKKK